MARAGHSVRLIWRFVHAGPVGSGLGLQPVGLAVLDRIVTGDDARRLAVPITHMLRHAGQRTVLDMRHAIGARGFAMHRGALFAVLWDAAFAAGVSMLTATPVTDAPVEGARRGIARQGADCLGPIDLVIDASGAGSPLALMRARKLRFGAVWGQVPWPKDINSAADQLIQRYLGAHRMAGILPHGCLPGDATFR